MKNIQLHYIQLPTILNKDTAFVLGKRHFFSIKVFRGYKKEGTRKHYQDKSVSISKYLYIPF